MSAAKARGIFERPRGSGIWWVDYRDHQGRRHREKIGRRKNALEAYEARKLQILEGRLHPPKPGATITFAKIAQERMDQKSPHLADASRETDRLRLRELLAAFGKLPADAVTAERIDAFLASVLASGRSKATANRFRSLLSSIFRIAVRNRRLAMNPCSQTERFRESPGRTRYLRPAEEADLREVIREECPEREPELDLALQTGMRRGEMYGLTRDGVDLERGILTVSGKTGQRSIHLSVIAKEALERILEHSRGPRVFPEPRTRWFFRCVKQAGIGNFRFHDCRHTFASRLVMAGVDIRTVASLCGHKSITMTQRYAHLSESHEKAAVERVGSGH